MTALELVQEVGGQAPRIFDHHSLPWWLYWTFVVLFFAYVLWRGDPDDKEGRDQ